MDGAANRSATVPQPTTAQGDSADLYALLSAAKVAGPLVLVGHSWGGLIAQTYDRTYPHDVAGHAGDPASQYLQTALPSAVWEQWVRLIATTGQKHPGAETPDDPASFAALDAAAPLPSVPVSILTSDKPFDYLGIGNADPYWPQWLTAGALLSAELHATHVTKTNSGHFIENENAALVVQQLCVMVGPAGGCPGGWSFSETGVAECFCHRRCRLSRFSTTRVPGRS